MIRTVIIEDEPKAAEVLSDMLNYHFPELELIGMADSVPHSIELIGQLQPDLVLSDIQLGKSCAFEIFQSLPLINFEVIFVSAYEQFAVQAIKFAAIDYLLKPFSVADLRNAIRSFQKRQEHKQAFIQFETLFHNLNQIQKSNKKIALPTTTGLEVIAISDIIRCQSQINYTYIYLVNKKKFVISRTLKEYDDLLNEYNFLRIHNSHLVNLNHIRTYIKGEGGIVIMTDGTSIEVSRRKKDQLIKKLSDL